MASRLAEIEAALDAAGLNLRGALPVTRYNAFVPAAWRTATLLPEARTALVMGSGGRALWDALRVAPEFDAVSDPVDTYTARTLEILARDLTRAGHPSRALYPPWSVGAARGPTSSPSDARRGSAFSVASGSSSIPSMGPGCRFGLSC
jgi:hypothetical protein